MSFRLLHTADWHLGRLFYGSRLTEDQAHVLERFVELVEEVRPHLVVVAGDVYDRAVPPPEAVGLLDDVLSRIVLGAGVPVVLVAGNHDSPERLEFGARLLEARGLHVAGRPGGSAGPLLLEADAESLAVYSLPYCEPAVGRALLGDEALHDHQATTAALLRRLPTPPAGARTMLVTHAFVAGGEGSESERPLSVGGSGAVDAATFSGFDLVTLGHLHRAQTVGDGDRLHYSGSLLKYSFSEAGHEKSISLIELDTGGSVTVERIALTPRRDVRQVTGSLRELLDGAGSSPGRTGGGRDDYLMVVLTDQVPVLDAVGRLREVYPNVMHVERPLAGSGGSAPGSVVPRGLSDREMFAAFWEQVTGEPLGDERSAAFLEVAEGLSLDLREAVVRDEPAASAEPAAGEKASASDEPATAGESHQLAVTEEPAADGGPVQTTLFPDEATG